MTRNMQAPKQKKAHLSMMPVINSDGSDTASGNCKK
jgi:hypothetical protein